MAAILDSKSLIRSIKRRAMVPISQETFSTEDLLEMATEEINIGVMDQIIEARGDYLVYFKDFDIEENAQYFIPSRAHGNKLRDVSIVDSLGNVITELSQIGLDELSDLNSFGRSSGNLFYVQNNQIVLPSYPKTSNYKIRMWFYMRPNKLVINDRGISINSISDGSEVIGSETVDVKILSFSSLPKHFNSSSLYDIVEVASPNRISKYDLTPGTVNLTLKTISFKTSDIGNVNVGDFVTIAEETIVPNLPTEYHPVIAQRVAISCLESMGDEQNKQSAERKLAQMEKAVLKIVTNRVEGAPRKIRQRHGTLNQSILKNWR